VQNTLEFPVLLRMIDERSTAFRAAVASAVGLETKVPTCPEWTLLDLVRHLGEVHRFWARVVDAGPADAPPADPDQQAAPEPEPESEPKSASEGDGKAAPREREVLLAWSAASTQRLLDALREAGPDRGCWTWWGASQSPQTAYSVARHQVQEAMVHTYDAQITAGDAQQLPDEAALDGVEEFLFTCLPMMGRWPHEAATVDYHATEGRAWRISLSAEGARAVRLPAPGTAPGAASGTATATATATGEARDTPDASARGTAADLVLVLYRRIPTDTLEIEGDRSVLDLLRDWNPDA
jgi:uncharacterized protein (TIGR03083 family)